MAISKIIGSGLGTINSPVEFTSTATIAGNVTVTSGLTVAGSPITGGHTGRNLVINGAMNVAQRAASVAGLGASAGYFTLDRFRFFLGTTSAGRLTMTQTADGPTGISANCLKLDCTTADTSIAAGERMIIQHKIEAQHLQRIGKGVVGAKQTTVSFYVKANASFTFGLEFFQSDHSRQCTKLFDTTTDWVRHEITFPADVDDGSSPIPADNGEGLVLQFWLHAGSTYTGGTLNTAAFADSSNANRAVGIDSFFSNTANNFFLTGLQMEVGPVATEFEQEDIGVTLARCQRYYQKISGASGATHKRFARGHNVSTTLNDCSVSLTSEMRTFPALETTGTAANYGIFHEGTVTACSAIPAVNSASDAGIGNSVGLGGTVGSGLTAGQGSVLVANNSTAAYLAFDAEL